MDPTTSSWLSCIDMGFFSGVASPVNLPGVWPSIALAASTDHLSRLASAAHAPVRVTISASPSASGPCGFQDLRWQLRGRLACWTAVEKLSRLDG